MTNVLSLELKGFDTSKVTDMSFIFQGCTKLKQFDFSSFKTNIVTTMLVCFIIANLWKV